MLGAPTAVPNPHANTLPSVATVLPPFFPTSPSGSESLWPTSIKSASSTSVDFGSISSSASRPDATATV